MNTAALGLDPDKLPALWEVLGIFLGGGALAFFAGWRRWWTGLVSVPALQLMGITLLAQMQDPFMGALLRAQRGTLFLVVAFFSVVLGGAVLPMLGATLGFLRSRETSRARAISA